jgi:O-antigen ligase
MRAGGCPLGRRTFFKCCSVSIVPLPPGESVTTSTAPLERYFLFLTTAVTGSGIVFFVTLPMAMAFVLPLCMVMPIAWYWFAEKRIPDLPVAPIVWWLALAGIYLFINASWSLAFPAAYLSAAALLALAGVIYVTIGALRVNKQAPLSAMALGLCIGMAIAGLYLSLEIFSNQWPRRQVMNQVAWLRIDPRHFIANGDRIAELFLYLMNRAVAAWTLLLWPTLFVLARLDLTGVQRGLLAAGLVAAVPTVFASDHETSKLALVGSAVTYGVYRAVPRFARQLVTAGWIAAVVLVVPTAKIALSSQLYLAPWLPASAQDRIVFWGHTSEQVWNAPFLGVGLNTSSVLSQPGDENAPRAVGSERRLSIRHHPHNAYLQVWYETGAVGALFLCGLGVLVLGSIARAPAETQPFLYATFVTCALVAFSSFSLWQPWFMFSFAFTAIFAVLASVLRPT